ncbi:MAG: hypothetical protein ABIR33_11070 [Pyrinomonadaceae bacterium]
MSKITYRSARPNDIERLGKIAYEAFYKISAEHNFPPDFPSPEIGIGLAGMMIGRDDIFPSWLRTGRSLAAISCGKPMRSMA